MRKRFVPPTLSEEATLASLTLFGAVSGAAAAPQTPPCVEGTIINNVCVPNGNINP